MVIGSPCGSDAEFNNLVDRMIVAQGSVGESKSLTYMLTGFYQQHGYDIDPNPQRDAVNGRRGVMPYSYALQLASTDQINNIITEILRKREDDTNYGLRPRPDRA